MAGDGIKRRPALAQADVGIAMDRRGPSPWSGGPGADGRGAAGGGRRHRLEPRHPAQHPAEPVLAFAYNVVLIPVRRGVLYPSFRLLLNPVYAAAAMGLSSVTVVTTPCVCARFARKRGGMRRNEGRVVTDPAEFRAWSRRCARPKGRIRHRVRRERTYFPGLPDTARHGVDVRRGGPPCRGDLRRSTICSSIPRVLKAGARRVQDLKIIHQRTGRVPRRLRHADRGGAPRASAQAAYASVGSRVPWVDVKKGHSYSDWPPAPFPRRSSRMPGRRPVSPPLHDGMVERLERKGAFWIEPEIADCPRRLL